MEDIHIQRESDSNFDVHHQGALCRELWNLRTEGTMCDVILDVNGEYLLGHRVILSACSAYLKTCCLNPEAISLDGLVQIKVENYSFKVCLKLFEFLYTGKPVDFVGPALDEFKKLCAEWDMVGITERVQQENGSIKTVSQDDSRVDASGGQTHPHTNLFDEYQVMHIDNQSQPKIENTEGGEDGHDSNHDDLWEPPTKKKVHAKRGRPRKSPNKTRTRPRSNDPKMPARKRGRPPKNKAAANQSELPLSTLEKDKMPNEEKPQYDSDTDVDDPNSLEKAQCESSESQTKVPVTDNADPQVTDNDTLDELDDTKSKTLSRKTRQKRAARTRQVIEANDLGMFICHICDAEFETKGKLQYHRKSIHRNKRQAWCKICSIKFSDENQLKAHNVEHHWKEGMELPTHYICETSESSSASDMSSAESESSPIQATAASSDPVTSSPPCTKAATFEVPSAETSSNKDSTQDMHSDAKSNPTKTSKKTQDFTCSECNVTFSRKYNYQRHMRAHIEPPFKCLICNRKFYKEDELEEHTAVEHAGQRYMCDECEREFKTKNALTLHIATHKGIFRFVCHHCGQGFSYSSNFKSHINRHLGEKPYACDKCDFKTGSGSDLINHKKSCGIEGRTFECDICNKMYKSLKSLRAHRKGHKDPMNYVCKSCGKGYPYQSSLLNHEKACGLAGNECDICHKTYKSMKSLMAHKGAHSNQFGYICGFCGKGYPYRTSLINHEKTCSVKTSQS